MGVIGAALVKTNDRELRSFAAMVNDVRFFSFAKQDARKWNENSFSDYFAHLT